MTEGREDILKASIDELKKITEEFPYFSAAHILLAKKTYQDFQDGQDYQDVYQRGLLYYHDPVEFEWKMKTVRSAESEARETPKEQEPIPPLPASPSSRLKKEEQESESETLTFEPYHTVDYFASQGIKITDTGPAITKFDRQLRSFTDWIKTMKKLPANEPPGHTGPDRGIERLAQGSVTDPHVVTESMAEVWLKQGNKEKAIGVYEKLSLQNPSKSAYFAAIIDNLKQS